MELYNKLLYNYDEEDEEEEQSCLWFYISYIFKICNKKPLKTI